MTKVETPTPVDLFRLLGEFEAPLAQQVIICPDEDGLLLLMVMSGLLPGAKPDPDNEPEVVAARWGTVEDLDNFIKILEQHRDRVFGPVLYGPRPAPTVNVDEGTAEKPAGLDSEGAFNPDAFVPCLHCRDTGRVRDLDSDIGWVACPFCGPPPAGNAA